MFLRLTVARSLKLALLLAICSAAIIWSYMKHNSADQRTTLVWVNEAATSLDPLKYDSFVHHITFTSVIGGLLTQYESGKFSGEVADSWESSPDYRVWKFRIRQGMRFENGDAITPEIILASLKRAAIMMKMTGSSSELFRRVAGIHELHSLKDSVPGLKGDHESITIVLNEPFPQLLETLSFRIYGIVHPDDYDEETGMWKDPRRITAAGAYTITSFDQNQIELNLRSDYPIALIHPSALKSIVIKWDAAERERADIIAGFSNENYPDGFMFFGHIPSNMAYVHCLSWKTPASPCYSIESRKFLRKEFYRGLEKLGVKHSRSFFPPTMKGIEQPPEDTSNYPPIDGKMASIGIRESTVVNPFLQAYNSAMEDTLVGFNFRVLKHKLPFSKLQPQLLPDAEPRFLDISGGFSGVLVEDPDSDIRFMFQSKEGIRLPDGDGRVAKELARAKIDVNAVNRIIWDQGLIWPIGHFSYGLWVKNKYDLSRLNLVLPPTQLSLIGHK